MTIRILCIVITLIVAVWVSREVNLSGGWTVIFTLLASAAVGFMGGICRVYWRHRRQKRTQEILNTPLDELADSVLKKYGEEDGE